MGKTGLQLIVVDFNNMENQLGSALMSETTVFMDDEDDTAHNKINTWLEKKRYMMYLGWNKEVYPKFRVQEVEI